MHIDYQGQDARLTNRDNLTLSFIKPIFEEWKGTKWR
jgi:hypothetical protein